MTRGPKVAAGAPKAAVPMFWGTRQAGLHRQNPAEFPTAKKCFPRLRQAICVIQIPEPAQDESVPHIFNAWTAVGARVKGIGEKKSIIGTARVEVNCFRAVVNDSAQSVAREKLEIMGEALVQLHSRPVIR